MHTHYWDQNLPRALFPKTIRFRDHEQKKKRTEKSVLLKLQVNLIHPGGAIYPVRLNTHFFQCIFVWNS